MKSYFCAGNTKNVRIVVMKNLLPSTLEIHHKFDLKVKYSIVTENYANCVVFGRGPKSFNCSP